MVHAIEFHGRLCRADGRPANPGAYDLRFRLHASRDGEASLWEDEVRGVPVAPGGYYHTVLGTGNALRPQLFDGSPRFLGVQVLRDGRPDEEIGDRVPVLGFLLKVAEGLHEVQGRVAALEAKAPPEGLPDAATVVKRIRSLRRRVQRMEVGESGLVGIHVRLAEIEKRLVRLDGEDGRVSRIEDELEDIVGPDGDVVDLVERMDALERRAGTPEKNGAARRTEDPVGQLRRRIEALEARLGGG